MGLPGDSDSKECACNVGDLASIPGLGRSPGEQKSYPLQYSDLDNIVHGLYSPRSCKESDMTIFTSFTLGKIPWKRKWLPTPVFWSGEFHIIHGVTKSWTQLSDFYFHSLIYTQTSHQSTNTGTQSQELPPPLSLEPPPPIFQKQLHTGPGWSPCSPC